jgi:putative ABC transport system permease protein
VSAVRLYHGGLLDLPDRRVWVIARPAADRTMIPPSQIVAGNAATAEARLRRGGWITVSQQIAAEQHVAPGDTLRLPTPTGEVAYRVAATTTNLGWGPGAIVINNADYARAWANDRPSAIEVNVAAGASLVATQRAIQRVVGPASGLQVQTTRERALHADGIAREGLARLSEISTLLLVAAALAMAAAMGASIHQRRNVVAHLRILGWRPPRLWRALLLEMALVLGVGCITGAAAGIYGHYLGDRWLQLTTVICVAFAAGALAATALPGWLVARASPRSGLKATP